MVVLTSRYGGKTAEYPGQTVLREWDLLTGPDIYTPFAGTQADRDAINTQNLATLQRVVQDQKPDVVFAWNLLFLDSSILDALEHCGTRTVVMLTDNWLLVMRNGLFVRDFFKYVVHGDTPMPLAAPLPVLPPPTLRQRASALLKKIAGRAPSVKKDLEAIFGSAFMRDFYAAGGSHFTRHQIVHNGVHQKSYSAVAAPDRSQFVEPGTLHLLFAGRLVDLKGAHTAVAALPLLDPASLGLSRIKLTILGDAQDTAYMSVLAAAIDASRRARDIELRPSVAEDALPALFNAFDIYLFPSLYEPFSLTLIHALALGIPTIASDIGGNVEIVRDGRSGVLFRKNDPASLADAIARLATDPALRARLAEGGRSTAAFFTFERMVAEMTAFLSGKS
jgi:glycosyltransferase involved in cell wall biosynthesis